MIFTNFILIETSLLLRIHIPRPVFRKTIFFRLRSSQGISYCFILTIDLSMNLWIFFYVTCILASATDAYRKNKTSKRKVATYWNAQQDLIVAHSTVGTICQYIKGRSNLVVMFLVSFHKFSELKTVSLCQCFRIGK